MAEFDPSASPCEDSLRVERDHLRLLLEVNNLLVTQRDLAGMLRALFDCLNRVAPGEYLSLSFLEDNQRVLRAHLIVEDGERRDVPEDRVVVVPPDASRRLEAGETLLLDIDYFADHYPEVVRDLGSAGFVSFCVTPLRTRRRTIGTLNVGSRKPDAFTPENVELLRQIAAQIAIAAENALAFAEISELKEQLANEKVYLEDEVRAQHDFAGIIGDSDALRRTLQEIEPVAATDSTVLLLGETGTGKELIAQAIHDRSPRCDRPFVRLNCAAIPATLLEAELFGHERGAFTGATATRIGRLEVANRGTLFLDEVGDLPLEVQPKLLRVLQEREFERLGSSRTVKADVRVIAATNRDLGDMVESGEFRADLFYRLSVFPIRIPPLRERREDIPALVQHFVAKHAQRLKRPIKTVDAEVMAALCRGAWPGNIRELENVIERAVILSKGGALRVSVPQAKASPARVPKTAAPGARLADIERDAIVAALRESQGVLAGPQGAAARLGLKRTTLQSRIRKLGIQRPSY